MDEREGRERGDVIMKEEREDRGESMRQDANFAERRRRKMQKPREFVIGKMLSHNHVEVVLTLHVA